MLLLLLCFFCVCVVVCCSVDLQHDNSQLRVHNDKVLQFRDMIVHASQDLSLANIGTNNHQQHSIQHQINNSNHSTTNNSASNSTTSYYFQPKFQLNDKPVDIELATEPRSSSIATTVTNSSSLSPSHSSFTSPHKFHQSFSPMPRLSPSALLSPLPATNNHQHNSYSPTSYQQQHNHHNHNSIEHIPSSTHHPLLDELHAQLSPHKSTIHKSQHIPSSNKNTTHHQQHISKNHNPVSSRVMDQLFTNKLSPPPQSTTNIPADDNVARIKLLFHDARCRMNDVEFQRFFELSKQNNIHAYTAAGESTDKNKDLILRLFEIKQTR